MDQTTSQKIIEAVYKKKAPSRERQLANKLVKQSEQNEKLREKIIKLDLFKLFKK